MGIWEDVVSSVAASLAGSTLSPKEIAIRAVNIGNAVAREIDLRDAALYAGDIGETARRELDARKGIDRETS
jgi:hypothetical protein